MVAIVNDGSKNRLGHLRWGLIPPWAKDEKIGYKMINARAETVSEKPSYKNAFKRKRCIIPADSFYEWKNTDNGKVPMRFKLNSNGIFALAGLWESWESPEGKTIHTCTVITTTPNELVKPVHNRMPVILKPEDEAAWLSPNFEDLDFLGNLLVPFDQGKMGAYPVSSSVNSPRNNDESLIIQVE